MAPNPGPVVQRSRTPAFQAGNAGSNPVGAAKSHHVDSVDSQVMSVHVYNRFVSILALVALIGAILLVVPAVRRAARSSATGWLWMAWLVASASTAGSLIYSEYFGFEPCRLCWYQRIAMYPLVLVLGIAAVRRDRAAMIYVIPQAAIGALVSAYHYLIQTFPDLSGAVCAVGVPCSAKYVNEFGFVSIPFMALAGFASIVALVSLEGRNS